MTAPPPTPPPPPGQQPPPPPQDDGLGDTALVVAIAALLAGAAVTAAYVTSVAGMLAVLKARFALSAAALQALGAVLTLVTEHPTPLTGIIGPASAQTSRMNAARRAQYVIAASKRVLGAAREARAKGLPVRDAVRAQLERERRFYELHQAAMWNRARAAGQTDMAAAEYGDLLGWNTVIDDHTSLECKVANGKNYRASRMPKIGFPGAVHPFVDAFRGHRIRVRQCSRFRYNARVQQIKHCLKCDQSKPVSEFYEHTSSSGKTYYTSPCKACTNERERARYLKNRETRITQTQKWHTENKGRVRELVKAWQERNPEWHQQNMLRGKARRYGLDEDLVIAYVGAHGGRCDICGRTAEEAGEQHRGGGRLCIDHDHATGEFRGLICHPCNLMLKDSQDDPGILRTAAAYLEDHPVRQFVMPAVARLDPRAVGRYAAAMRRRGGPELGLSETPLVADPRFCSSCGTDISHRHSNARYCEQCRPSRSPSSAPVARAA